MGFENRLRVRDFLILLQIGEIPENSQSSSWISLPHPQFYMYTGAVVGVLEQFRNESLFKLNYTCLIGEGARSQPALA